MPRRDPFRAVPLPAIADLARHCAARLHTPERQLARRRFSQEFEPLLDALCAAFAARALRELAGDKPIEPEALIESGHIAASSAPMLRNLLQLLTEDGVVQPIGNQWLWRTDVALPKPEDIWASLISDYPEYALLTAGVGASGLHLGARLHAGTPAASAKAGHPDTVSTWADGCTQQEAAAVAQSLADMLRLAADIQPPHARLRVLRFVGIAPVEGLALVPLLDADRCDVVIGSASQAVLDDLRARWPVIDTLECQIVDLDGDSMPAIAGGGFDIVVLGEGLADAPDPSVRLKNARRLLLDDGLLVLLEKHASRAADLMLGLEPHWWRVANDGETESVRSRLCAPDAWRALLAQAGFETIEAVHDVPEVPAGPYVLIAQADTAQRVAALPQPSAPPRTWLIARDAAGYSADLGRALGNELAALGQRVVTVIAAPIYTRMDALCHALDPCDPSHWNRLLATLREEGEEPHGWIHLAGLDLATASAPLGVRAAAQELRATVFTAWLQTCARRKILPECWVVAAHAGIALLPAAAGSAAPAPQVDVLRDAALWGIARVAMQEFADQRIRWLDLHDPLPCASNAARLAGEILHPDAEDEILLAAGGRYVPRLGIAAAPRPPVVKAPQPSRRQVQLDCLIPGPFRNLHWQAAADPSALADDEVEIDVRCAGLNFRDVMYAMGLLPDEAVEDGFCGPTLGMEVAGLVIRVGAAVNELTPGDAVIAFAPASFANRVRTRALAVARKPAHWSFAAAATVPTAFFTAYYALHELARLREGEKVLIHGAAGGVGIAAIQLAKHLGAEIFATAGSDMKRDFVRLLGADHVFDSRSLEFADQVMRASGGGVDVVLNSLAGDAIARNLRLLRPFGRMLELGKRDFYENSRIGLRPLRNNISYFGIDADQLLAQRPDTARRVFIDLMALFADGSLHPLPHRTFDAADIATAFRHMQASRHIGKVVVTFAPDFDPLGAPLPQLAPVAKADATYVVTGGLSGFGLRSAWWLVRHGARHLALLSRRGADDTPGAEEILQQFAAAGVSVVAPPCDVADASAVRAALASIAHMPPLRGIVHAAMVVEDALLRDLDPSQLHRVLAPKIRGAWELHEATRDAALDFFIMYSSATTLFGNPGQAAYVAANMALEALATERRALGLPATCIGWGPIADTGYLARNERMLEALVGRMGGAALKSDDALRELETLRDSSAANLGLIDLDWSTLSRFLPAAHAPKFLELARTVVGERVHGESAHDLRCRLEGLVGEALVNALTEIVRHEVAEILRIVPERIEPGISLLDMGMDSLMAVELATSIGARLDIQLSALALSGGPTIESVVERVIRLLHPAEDPAAVAAGAALEAQVLAVAEQHMGGLSAESAAQFSAEIGAAAAPLSLTAGQRP
jgi:NADPH:quinone reductase-like Zn-dependent oxidoreductase/acyl carrier protein/NADP-dependent 3-hydroxy acid dehydrogenase YdfG/SAM-dependent methyltransferase